MEVVSRKKTGYLTYIIVTLCAITAAIIAGYQFQQNDKYIGNDSTQYLAGSESLLNGEGFSTRILFFDEHYTSGDLPASQTVWPPGLSVLMAMSNLVGMDTEDGGRLISAIAYILLVTGVFFLTLTLTGSLAAATIATIWQLLVADMWSYSGSIGSDLLFTTLSTWCILLYATSMRNGFETRKTVAIPYPTLALISLIAGIGFCFRYTSVFLIAWVMLLIFIEFVRGIRTNPSSWLKQFFYSTLAALPSLLLFFSLVVRNLIISGSIKGGNTKVVYNSIIDLSIETIRSFVIVLTGVTKADFFDASIILAIIGSLTLLFFIAGIASSIIQFTKAAILRKFNDWKTFCCFMIAVFILIYVIGLIIISSRSFASYGSRYLLSAMPLVIVIIVSLWRKYQWGLWVGIGFLSISQFIFFQGNLLAPTTLGKSHESAYSAMSKWISENTKENERVIVLGDGQRIGYHIKRPTLAVPIRHFTSETWDENRLQELALKYDVKILIASKNDIAEEYEEVAKTLMHGNGSGWIQLLQNTDNAYIYALK